jgi:hypothetical protein
MAPITLYASGSSTGVMTYDWRKATKCVKKEGVGEKRASCASQWLMENNLF